MTEFHWTIDEALRLTPVDKPAISDHATLIAPEQVIDTVLTRNLDVVPQALFGVPAKFLFHSAIFWGAFDLGCILADGRFIAFENKGRRLTKADFRKFKRDVQTLATTPGYAQMRYEHVLNDLPGYLTIAKRMFAASFLGLRCDVLPNLRDLTLEACESLLLDRESFQTRFAAGNQWFDALSGKPTWADYLGQLATDFDSRKLTPVLLAPNSDVCQIERWRLDYRPPYFAQAQLIVYRLGSRTPPVPTSLSLALIGDFAV